MTPEESAAEEARRRSYPGIAFRGREGARRAWVMGTGFDVWELIQADQDSGADLEAMLRGSELDSRQLKLALVYYRDFPAEIDRAIAANRRSIEQLREEYPFIEVLAIDD